MSALGISCWLNRGQGEKENFMLRGACAKALGQEQLGGIFKARVKSLGG